MSNTGGGRGTYVEGRREGEGGKGKEVGREMTFYITHSDGASTLVLALVRAASSRPPNPLLGRLGLVLSCLTAMILDLLMPQWKVE